MSMAEYSSPACYLHEFEDDALTIYHNPACSKSRATLELARASGVPLTVVEYLKTPPSAAELAVIIARLGLAPADLVRKGEAVFKERFAGRRLSDAQWIEAMVAHPILIERPIVVGARGGAVIGRPPENLRALLPDRAK
jgi:arsenate reductase